MKNHDNGIGALKCVMAFAMLICSLVIALAVELAIAGTNITHWTFAERGLWLALWTIIAYAIAIFLCRDLFFAKNVDFDVEDNE